MKNFLLDVLQDFPRIDKQYGELRLELYTRRTDAYSPSLGRGVCTENEVPQVDTGSTGFRIR